MFDEPIPNRSSTKRLEDLGAVKYALGKLIDQTEIFSHCESKHSHEIFVERFSGEIGKDRLYDLHDELRFFKNKLDDIYTMALGMNWDYI